MIPMFLNLDAAAPFLVSATISGETELTLLFSEAVTRGVGHSDSDFAITLSGGAATLTYASGDGTAMLVFTISRTVTPDETGTLDYTQPTDGIEADDDGTDLDSFTDTDLVNGLASYVTVFEFLTGQLGDSYQINDMWMDFLAAEGYSTGSLNDRLLLWLANEGYPGALPDKFSAWVYATFIPHV